ncbi:MAG: hypothetical protein SFV51_24925 [Bryobacteraceae bacterium]|nr:hypothetical protein [Bryobacteraceae bacterium]
MSDLNLAVPPEAARTAAKLISGSKTLSSSPALRKLLHFLVEATLEGRSASQREVACLLAYRNFDPLENSGVRREVGRLRDKLRQYYDEEGTSSEVIIVLPRANDKSGYRVQFRLPATVLDKDSANPQYLLLTGEARRLWAQRTPQALEQAISLFQQAIELDHDQSARAHAAIAECYCFLALGGAPPHAAMPRAKEWAERSIALNPTLAAGYATLGFATSVYDWDWALAEQLFQRAIQLSPASLDVRCWYSGHLVAVGRFEDAVRQVRKVQIEEHDPAPVVASHLAKILHMCGHLDEAFDLMRFALKLDPDFYLSHWHMGLIMAHRGDQDAALCHLRRATELMGEDSGVWASLGYVCGASGLMEEARECLAVLDRMAGHRYVPATDFATVFAGLNDAGSAFRALDLAFEQRCLFLSWAGVWPPYERLRQDSRFRSILNRLGLGGASRRDSSTQS